jgi:hypothetical protein
MQLSIKKIVAGCTDALGYASTSPLQFAWVVLFGQMVTLIFLSFLHQSGPELVKPFYFGCDYLDFHRAAVSLAHHTNPYASGRIFSPPSSLLYGLILVWLPFRWAAFVIFFINIFLLLASIHILAIRYEMERWNRWALFGIASLFYPTYFLIQRGNMDAVMLALLCLCLRFKNRIFQALLLGTSMAFKAYSGLIFVLLPIRKRNWGMALGCAIAYVTLQIPFVKWEPFFVRELAGRANLFGDAENISPSVFFYHAFHGHTLWKFVFIFFWSATLIWKILRSDLNNSLESWPTYIPWMMSLPVVVYPYTGILALALLAYISNKNRHFFPTYAGILILIGFLLLGFQTYAWESLLSQFTKHAINLNSINATGTVLMILGACGLPKSGVHSTVD